MKIELRKLSEIKPYPGNPRQNDAAVDAVAASIREFGWRAPIVVATDGGIVCGHTPHKAGEKATWDYELLPIELADLQAAEFDLGLLGFSEKELAQLLEPDVKNGL